MVDNSWDICPPHLPAPIPSLTVHCAATRKQFPREIRLILANLAERLAFARSQSDELKSAVKRLVARKEQRGKKIPASGQGSQQTPPSATGKHGSGGGPATTPP